MSLRSCTSIRRRLQEFLDGELPVDLQVTIQSHLRSCGACAAEARDLEAIGSALRETATVLAGMTPTDELAGLPAGVVSRLKAEDDQSLRGRVGRMFEDMHLLWAALGATAATSACLAIMVGIFYFAATHERPDSLAGMISAAALPGAPLPGSNENPLSLDGSMLVPRVFNDNVFATSGFEGEEDAVFTLAAVVTREGRIANLELVRSHQQDGVRPAIDQQEVLDLLDTISRARFQPARSAGSPVAVNMVWLFAHLTVRGKVPISDSRSPVQPHAISRRMLPSPASA